MTLTDEDARHMVISMLTAETQRDAQRKIGASNLSNGCDFCLASNLTGDMRTTPMLDRAWGGRTLGTAIHAALEQRANNLDWFKDRYPDARVEQHMTLGALGSYGEIGSTPDLTLPSEQHVFDWKGTTKKKSALMRDYLGQTAFGRTHKDVKLSEKVYTEEMLKSEYRITGYYSQLQSYMRGLNNIGIPTSRASIVFVSRDDTMWWDNPASSGYSDETKMRGVWVLSFDYDEHYAQGVWNRGLAIWEALESGRVPSDFEHHKHCFPCGLEVESGAIAA